MTAAAAPAAPAAAPAPVIPFCSVQGSVISSAERGNPLLGKTRQRASVLYNDLVNHVIVHCVIAGQVILL